MIPQRRDLLLDKDRTPTTSALSSGGKQSAISRLENKYSDILERAAGRRRHEEDRDKTLEPDDYGASGSGGLLRSATAHQLAKSKLSSSSFNASDRKERTPYRTRAQRQRYMAESNDSGYLTSGNRLLDENYPVDYGQRYDYHDALRLGGASGYPSSRYGRRGGEEEALSPRSTRAYGRTKTVESLLAAEIQDSGRNAAGPAEDRPLNSRNRFAHRRKEQPPEELTAEEREILADDRSSEDNAAILMLLREDNQFLEAKKFEERMRKRRELRDRVKRIEEAAEEAKKTEAAVAAAEAEAAALEQEAKKAKEAAAAAAIAASTAAATSSATAATLATPQEAPKKKSRSKKVTRDGSDCSGSSESTSGSSSSDEAETETETDSAAPGVQLTHTADTTPQTSFPSVNGTTTTSSSISTTTPSNTATTSSTSTSALSNHTTATATALSSGTTNKSRFLPHSDRNNNDLAKYKPSSQLMHSSSSGALAFGGIGARLAAADARRQQQRYQGASSRTAAVLSEFDRYKPLGSGTGSGSSYLHDSYSGSSRRSNALGGSSLYPQRSQLDAYQQQYQQSSSYLQHDHYQLAKSATSSALFNRSRIPKTLSTFVSNKPSRPSWRMGDSLAAWALLPPPLLTATAIVHWPWSPIPNHPPPPQITRPYILNFLLDNRPTTEKANSNADCNPCYPTYTMLILPDSFACDFETGIKNVRIPLPRLLQRIENNLICSFTI